MTKRAREAKKTKLEIRSEQQLETTRIANTTQRVQIVAGAVVKTVFFGTLAVVVYCIAGKETVFRAVIEAAFKGEVNEHLADVLLWVAGGTGWAAFARERAVRKKEVEKLSSHNKKLELIVDPKRSSTGLTSTGERALPPGGE